MLDPEVPDANVPDAEVPDIQVDAIVRGKHRDPFSFLGPHDNLIRAWLPQAREAVVVFTTDAGAGRATPMQQSPTGFFSASLAEPTRDYRIRITLYSGESRDLDDPYRFPPCSPRSSCTCTGKAPTMKAIALWARTWFSARAWTEYASPCGRPTPRWSP